MLSYLVLQNCSNYHNCNNSSDYNFYVATNAHAKLSINSYNLTKYNKEYTPIGMFKHVHYQLCYKCYENIIRPKITLHNLKISQNIFDEAYIIEKKKIKN